MKQDKSGATDAPFSPPPVDTPPVPEGLQQLDSEVEQSSSETTTITSFDNVKLKKM
jgi:hypothetical protein